MQIYLSLCAAYHFIVRMRIVREAMTIHKQPPSLRTLYLPKCQAQLTLLGPPHTTFCSNQLAGPDYVFMRMECYTLKTVLSVVNKKTKKHCSPWLSYRMLLGAL